MNPNAKPADASWIMAYLNVSDCDRAVKFYEDAFGFTNRFTLPDDEGQMIFSEMDYRGVGVMVGLEGAFGSHAQCPQTTGHTPPSSLYVYCDDVDAQCQRVKECGATVTEEPVDMFWGDRMFKMVDPFGYTWTFATKIEE